MGLLDELLGAATGSIGGTGVGAGTGGGGGAQQALLQAAMHMIGNPANGGLSGLIGKLNGAGLGPAVSSWVGTGANHPVSGDQLASALGPDQMNELAAKSGLPTGAAAGHLAQILPALIDHLTPNGQVPADHSLVQSALGMLRGRMMGQ